MKTRTLAVALLFLAAGCHGYLRPRDEAPLPARSILTRSGEILWVDDGQPYLSSGLADIGAALGAGLEEEAGGVVVTNPLRAESGLRSGDRILHVSPVLPARGEAEEVGAADDGTVPRTEAPVPKTLAELRALPQSHPVQNLDDLRGYRSGKGWLSLDLGIRRGAEEIVVRERVEVERRRFTVERFDPGQVFRRNGIALCALEGWPEERLPVLAARSDVLVLRVERHSEAGKAGLRPLDLVTDVERFRLTGKAQVRKPGGALKTVTVPRRAGRIDLWIPLLFSFESDGFRSHKGLGPLDVLSHSSSSTHYDAATDGYTTAERESGYTIFQRLSWEGQGGVSSFYQLNPFIDAARWRYLIDYEPFGETSEGREGEDPSLDWAKGSEVESGDRPE